jgi:metal-responsive CopG/Arc/MetJ family transcriptional regulator
MKTAISIPDTVFQAAERIAQKLGMSRSELYSKAIAEFVVAYDEEGLTEELNQIYANEDSSLDPVVQQIMLLSLPQEEW